MQPDASLDLLVVGVLTKGHLEQSATHWAQGGVAAVLGGDPDSTDLHLAARAPDPSAGPDAAGLASLLTVAGASTALA